MSGSNHPAHVALVDFIIQRGSPVTEGNPYYGWLDGHYTELRMHMAGCRPVYTQCTWQESEWDEFQGTFDPDIRRQGVDLTLTCMCGEISGRTWRYDGGYAELIRAITEG